MIGFEIFVYRADRVDDPMASWPNEEALLVSWLVGGSSGLDWIDALVERGLATDLGGNGYPLRYTALARDLLPVIATGIPAPSDGPILGEDYYLPAGFIRDPEVRPGFDTCPCDQLLLVNAWDQS